MRKAITMWTNKDSKDLLLLKSVVEMLNKNINPFAHKAELITFGEGGYILVGTDYTEREYNKLTDSVKKPAEKV